MVLAIGVLGMTAVWLAAYLHFRTPSGWLSLVAAVDIALMLRLAAAPAGRARAGLAVAGTLAAIALSAWMMVATQLGLLIGLTPLESAQRLGPVLFGEMLRHGTSGWDLAWALLALPLAWRLAR